MLLKISGGFFNEEFPQKNRKSRQDLWPVFNVGKHSQIQLRA
jgi:hypothetical protein